MIQLWSSDLFFIPFPVEFTPSLLSSTAKRRNIWYGFPPPKKVIPSFSRSVPMFPSFLLKGLGNLFVQPPLQMHGVPAAKSLHTVCSNCLFLVSWAGCCQNRCINFFKPRWQYGTLPTGKERGSRVDPSLRSNKAADPQSQVFRMTWADV